MTINDLITNLAKWMERNDNDVVFERLKHYLYEATDGDIEDDIIKLLDNEADFDLIDSEVVEPKIEIKEIDLRKILMESMSVPAHLIHVDMAADTHAGAEPETKSSDWNLL